MSKNIEAELRSFISEKKYAELKEYFDENATLESDDYQETFYFDCKEDLRIQKNNAYAKVWLKKGELHDDSREEIEIHFDKKYFDKLESLFLTLGYKTEIKWFRKRVQYKWNDITVCLDYTKGFGYILEFEKMCSENEKEQIIALLKSKFAELDIPISDKSEFKEKFEEYKLNWRELVK